MSLQITREEQEVLLLLYQLEDIAGIEYPGDPRVVATLIVRGLAVRGSEGIQITPAGVQTAVMLSRSNGDVVCPDAAASLKDK